ncbi:MAG: GAF domain-containing protein [Anaerolineales bacterium]|nr:GAF domain-containing protein [Anaerolineales bacterium]
MDTPATASTAPAEVVYREILERSGYGMFQSTAEGRFLFINATLAQLCGYASPAEMMAAVTDIRNQLYVLPQQYDDYLRQLEAEDNAPIQEVQIYRKDGTRLWVQIRARAVRDGAGRVLYYEGTLEDITARRQTQLQLERSARQLTALSQMGLAVTSSLDQTIVLNRILDETLNLLCVDGVAVLLLEGEQLVMAAVGGSGTVSFIGRRMPAGAGVAGKVVRTGRSVVIQDEADRTQLYRPLEQFTVYEAQSLLAAPLKLQGEVIGVIEVVHEAPTAFLQDDVQMLEAAASWAALAIGNARQHALLERRLQESEALSVISQALNETHDLDTILKMIVDSARQIIPKVERAIIHLLDEDAQTLRPAAYSGDDPLSRFELAMRPGEGVAGRVLAEGVPINVGDICTDPRYLPGSSHHNMRSLLVAPVQSGDRRLGTISVQSAEPYAFSADDQQLLRMLGLQAALAIENARLLAAESRARRDAEVLGEIGTILSSTLDYERVLDRLLEQVNRLVPFDMAALMLVEGNLYARTVRQRGYERFGEAVVHAVSGLALDITVTPRLRHMAETGQPLVIPDVRADPGWLPRAATAHIGSWVGAPIVVQGQGVIAFFSLEKLEPGFYTAEHGHRLAAFAGQASLAIQNARLYANLERALRHEKSIRAQLVQTEKLAAMGRLVASVAHELNNPLQAIQNSLYLVIQENELTPQAREDLQVALTEADRMAALINRLRETYRPATAEQFSYESLNSIIEEVQKLIATHLRHNNVLFSFEPDPRLPRVPGLRDQLKQVILNLCLNAVEAMPRGGELRLRTEYLPKQGEVLVTISDTGEGIDPLNLRNIFEPFFTTKQGGTGLGLFITHEIIQRHQGRIEAESEVGRGTTFRVWLPVTRTMMSNPDAPFDS